MKGINWMNKTHKGWVNVEIDLPAFMKFARKQEKCFYVKRGNKNEVKGRIDRFKKFVTDNPKTKIVPAEFYFLIDKKTYKFELIIVNGRHRLASLLEDGYKTAVVSIPKEQKLMFSEFYKYVER